MLRSVSSASHRASSVRKPSTKPPIDSLSDGVSAAMPVAVETRGVVRGRVSAAQMLDEGRALGGAALDQSLLDQTLEVVDEVERIE